MVCLVAGCAGGGGGDGPSAVVTAPERTTTTLSAVEREVEAAYLKSWDIYARALDSLDGSELPTTHAGRALESVRAEVTRLRMANTPVRVRVDHSLTVRLLSHQSAEVVDRYVNHMVLVDAKTREPIEPDPNRRVRYVFTLKLIGGMWKVTGIA